MSKNHDDELVRRGEAKKALMEGLFRDRIGRCSALDKARIEQDINQLPAEKIRPIAEIEKARESLEKNFNEMKTRNYPWGAYQELRRNINLLKFVLTQTQEEKGYPGSTWTDKGLLGKED